MVEFISIERYVKEPEATNLYHEAMCITSDLTSLERAFLILPTSSVLPKETILISALKGLLKQNSIITVIGHLIPTNYEDSLNTVQ